MRFCVNTTSNVLFIPPNRIKKVSFVASNSKSKLVTPGVSGALLCKKVTPKTTPSNRNSITSKNNMVFDESIPSSIFPSKQAPQLSSNNEVSKTKHSAKPTKPQLYHQTSNQNLIASPYQPISTGFGENSLESTSNTTINSPDMSYLNRNSSTQRLLPPSSKLLSNHISPPCYSQSSTSDNGYTEKIPLPELQWYLKYVENGQIWLILFLKNRFKTRF